jgi:hypothetical protein
LGKQNLFDSKVTIQNSRLRAIGLTGYFSQGC